MARDQLLARLRQRLGVNPGDRTRHQIVNLRCDQHKVNTIPARARLSHPDLVDQFEYYLNRAQASVSRVKDLSSVPQEIVRQLDVGNRTININADVEAMQLPFDQVPELILTDWSPKTSLAVGVTSCFAAVAETGTIVITSSKTNAISHNFLAEKHIVLLAAKNIVGAYEEIWQKIRLQKVWPRDITFVSGPSCTGDIEMVIEYGAHGPRQLHVIIIGEGPSDYQPL